MTSSPSPTTKEQITDKEKLTNTDTIRSLLPRFKDSVLGVSNFKVISKVGEGAFAQVYKCLHIPTKQIMAVKVMKPKIFSRESDVYDFFLEAQLLRKIRHPHVVPFKGICFGTVEPKKQQTASQSHQQESLCVVTEFMDGGSLKEWIYARMTNPHLQVYSQRQAIRWMTQIAKGLVYLHGTPFVIVHRDLKPENILLQEKPGKQVEYEAKIADFGLSVVIARKGGGVPSTSVEHEDQLEGIDSGTLPELLRHGKRGVTKNTETLRRALNGVSACIHAPQHRDDPPQDMGSSTGGKDLTGRTGSLMYMAPEVLRYQKYNEKVDVFSYGIILYEVLQGFTLLSTLPKTATIADVKKFAANVADGFRMPLPEEWPYEIKALIRDCWHAHAAKRPTMKQVVRRLEEMYNNGIFEVPQSPPPKPVKKRRVSWFRRFLMFPYCRIQVHKDSIKTTA